MLVAALLSVTILLPGVLVVVNKRSEYREWLFLALSVSLSLWVFTNFLVDYDDNRALLWTRSTFFAVVWACYFFFEFTHHFPENISVSKIWRRLVLAGSVILSIVIYTPFFITSVRNNGGVVDFTPGVAYPLFLAYYPAVLISAFFILVRGLLRAHGVSRERAKTVLFALIGMTAITSTTNLVLPELFSITALAPYGGYATIIFTVGVAYAMLRHHLFDVRAAAARATAYILSVGVIIGSYSIFTLALTEYVIPESSPESWQRFIYVIFIALVAILYQPVKGFFDKVTNKVFFRDAYDPQVVLDKLSDQLVGTINLEQLMGSSSELVVSAFKSSYCMILLINPDGGEPRIFGNNKKLTPQSALQVMRTLQNHSEWPVVVDELEESHFRAVLDSVKSYFVTEMSTKTQKLGFIVLGEKKNGNIYSGQDATILSIIADELALGLENALRFEQIEDFNLNLQKKIDTATRELRKSNNKLKALDEAKDEFISMASHQLRTPLTSIKGYLSMVLEGDVGPVPDQQKEMLNTAYMSAQRMVYLISDLLNVSRLQTGKFMIEPVDCYLPDVVSEELNQLRESASAKNITIEYDKPESFPTMKLDDTKIRQVIMNFSDNALYYTKDGGKVVISLADKPKSIEFTVTDNGIGVPKAEQHKLFAKFYRAGNARKARPDGTGLGLFMAQKVIVASGGAVIFRSTEGKGSTFGFTFPKS